LILFQKKKGEKGIFCLLSSLHGNSKFVLLELKKSKPFFFHINPIKKSIFLTCLPSHNHFSDLISDLIQILIMMRILIRMDEKINQSIKIEGKEYFRPETKSGFSGFISSFWHFQRNGISSYWPRSLACIKTFIFSC